MVDNTNKLNTQYNFAIPTTQEEREKIILLAVKMLTEKEGGNITLNQLLSYVDNNLNNLSNEVAQALINKSNNGHNHDDRYYTEDEVNTKVNELKNTLINKINTSDSLTYEQIMASTDLTGKVASASALKNVDNKVKNKLYDGVLVDTFDSIFSIRKTGMFPLFVQDEGDYYLIQMYRDENYGCQIRIKIDGTSLQIRSRSEGQWTSWRSF